MAKLRSNEAKWIESAQRWRIDVQSGGVRRTFVSDIALGRARKGKLQAERKADAWLEQRLNDENQKVEILFDKWIEALKARTQTAYWKQYDSYGRNWIKPAVGHKRMAALTETDLDNIIAAAYKKGLAKKSLSNIRSCLTAFLKYARKSKATTLVADDIILPRNAPTGTHRCLKPDEVVTVLTSDLSTFNRKVCRDVNINLYRFLLFEGLRPGEVLGLQTADVHDGYYEINRAVNSLGEVTTGKNENARRRHALSAYSKMLLDRQRAELRERGIVSHYVFPGPDGRAMKQSTLYKAWGRYCKYNHLTAVSLYELRHTNYSVNKDMPVAYKKALFGHSANFDGDAVYDHILDGQLEVAASMNEAAFMKLVPENQKCGL